MKTYQEADGFIFQYNPKEKRIYYPYDRVVTPEVKERFHGWKIQLILF